MLVGVEGEDVVVGGLGYAEVLLFDVAGEGVGDEGGAFGAGDGGGVVGGEGVDYDDFIGYGLDGVDATGDVFFFVEGDDDY